MLIKYQSLPSSLKKKLHALYVLIGHDHYLLNDAASQIKQAWYQQGDSDNKILDLNTSSDWEQLLYEANHYSLFAEHVLIDARIEKKSIESAGKDMLNQYLVNVNQRCLIILRARNIPAKQWKWLNNHDHVLLVQAYPLTEPALLHWMASQFQNKSILYDPQILTLIHQHTQGNMLASAQFIEKLALLTNQNERITTHSVMEQLIDQCNYQYYELSVACLSANAHKAIHLLRQARLNRTEPTLILWLMVQEIRQLIQLTHLLRQSITLSSACKQLNIWPQRIKLYQMALSRLPLTKLYLLLQISQQLDERIKMGQNNQIWHEFEQLALAICNLDIA